ncbi:MAG: c-type cytochrome [Magnetococcales bacterium]|nr:c-type cytochrome [Magnetococcales bacterium]
MRIKKSRWLACVGGVALLFVGLVASDVSAGSKQLVRKGNVLFEENCVACHQKGGVGQAGVAPSLTNKEFLSIASDKFLFETIRDGRTDTPMPAFGEMLESDEDITAIVAYLRTFSQGKDLSSKVENARAAMGDPRLGKRWFQQVCEGCHGVRGQGGYDSEGSGTAIGKAGFLNKASDGFIRYIIKNGRSNTAMRGFSGPTGLANLSDQEIDDIISYLRILQ